ncbi:DUF7694 domain-containing protein [Sphingomonas koreensis]|uniref:DUF7694 domain-containing protein n=1 Tax=Sphingomonas koreensis TaxID=93064 RepID=UPI0019D22FE6|nr:hypothetical protein [Sphingomonas koreensis]
MLKPNAAQLRQLRRDNAQYSAHLVEVPRADWPPMPFLEVAERIALFRSRQFLVQVVIERTGFTRLSVNRTEWDERANRWREDIGWDDLQRLKGEAGFADRWAVEVFPDDASVVNVANMRHLFLLPEAPAYGWRRVRRLPLSTQEPR